MTAHAPSVTATASAAVLNAAAKRRVATSQNTNGQRKSFSAIADPSEPATNQRRSRQRQAAATNSIKTGVRVPGRTAPITAGEPITTPATRQSRTPRIQIAPPSDAMISAAHTTDAVSTPRRPKGAKTRAAPAGYGNLNSVRTS